MSPTEDEGGHLAHLYSELQDDILTSYDRDEPPELDSGMIDARIGTARIGAGPLDVVLSGDPAAARRPNRWPLDASFATRAEVRSKALAIQIALDQNAGWMSDELSWRLEVCGRVAVIPLRVTALYARDGDRWITIFEHMSFGWPLAPGVAPAPRKLPSAFSSVDLKDELSGVLGRGLFHAPHDASVVAQDPLAIALGPDAGDEWHGRHVVDVKLPDGRLEDRRLGIVGRDPATATVAYWIGSYRAEVPSQNGAPPETVTLRVTHVFEKRHAKRGAVPGVPGEAREPREDDACGPAGGRTDSKAAARNADCRWTLVQSHVSQPVTADQLTRRVFGSARPAARPISLPWFGHLLAFAPKASTRLDCSDGRPAADAAPTPEAAPRAPASPAAARSP
ncbi:MAG TPA: hypothetical protein VGC42_14540 [Kofleriaceae bacterium]